MKVKLSETQVQREILSYLESKKICAFRMNTQGTFRKDPKAKDGYRITPNANRGFADILVLYKGHAIFLEVKSEKGKMSEDQHNFANRVVVEGCSYFLVRSKQDVKDRLKDVGVKL